MTAAGYNFLCICKIGEQPPARLKIYCNKSSAVRALVPGARDTWRHDQLLLLSRNSALLLVTIVKGGLFKVLCVETRQNTNLIFFLVSAM